MNHSYRNILLGILAAGLVVRAVLFLAFMDTPDRFYDDDSFGYIQLAENMRLGHGFSRESVEPFTPDAFRTPGYPFFLLAHRVVFGSYTSALATQSLMVMVIAIFVYRIAERLGYPRAGLGGAMIFVFMPFSIMVSLRFLTQPLFTFVVVLSVWFWLRFLHEKSWSFLVMVGVLLPVAALVRPIAIYLYVPFILTLLFAHYLLGWKQWRTAVGQGALIALLFLAGVSPWLIRNYQEFRVFGFSSITSYQLYFYDAPSVYGARYGMTHPEAKEYLEQDIQRYAAVQDHEEYFDFRYGPILRQRALDIMFESPLTLVITRGTQFLKFFVRDGVRYWQDWFPRFGGLPLKSASAAERVVLVAISLGALRALVRTRNAPKGYHMPMIALSMVIGYFAALTGVMASAGLRFPVEPFILILGMIGLEDLAVRYGILRNG